MQEIKSCPFCGKESRVENHFGKDWWVQCEDDHVDGGLYGSALEAVLAWNFRVPNVP